MFFQMAQQHNNPARGEQTIPDNVIRIGCANMHCMWRHDGMQRTATYVTHCRKNRASICERMHNEQQHTDHDFRMQHNLKTQMLANIQHDGTGRANMICIWRHDGMRRAANYASPCREKLHQFANTNTTKNYIKIMMFKNNSLLCFVWALLF